MHTRQGHSTPAPEPRDEDNEVHQRNEEEFVRRLNAELAWSHVWGTAFEQWKQRSTPAKYIAPSIQQ